MEASENPRLPFDEGASGEASVRAIDDRLVIERLTVADAGSARVVREQAADGRAPADTVAKAIEIGTRVIDSEGTAVNVDYVRRELESGLGDLDRRLGGTLEEGAEALAERIAATFGAERNDSVQAQIKEIVTAESRHQRDELLARLTAEDPTNPLVAMQVRIGKRMLETEERHRQEVELLRESHGKESRTMQAQVAELKEHLARLLDSHGHELELAEVEEAGTRKGITFEERVHEAIEAIAGARGDVASHTGAEQAEGGGKKGDTLVEIGACEGSARGRIVFEAKDKQLTKNKAWSELNAAMEARAAAFGVLIVAGDENVPAGREQLTEYEGNKLIVAVDREDPSGLPLDLAYRLAAARVAMARDRDLTVDAPAVRDAAQEAISTLKHAQAIRSTLTGIKSQSDRARDGLDTMVAAVEAKLEQIDSLVAEAEEADAASETD
jgi:hypothetical protein